MSALPTREERELLDGYRVASLDLRAVMLNMARAAIAVEKREEDRPRTSPGAKMLPFQSRTV